MTGPSHEQLWNPDLEQGAQRAPADPQLRVSQHARLHRIIVELSIYLSIYLSTCS